MVRFLINVPIELQQRLREQAQKRGATLNGLIRQILWKWLEDNTDKDAS